MGFMDIGGEVVIAPQFLQDFRGSGNHFSEAGDLRPVSSSSLK
jgi:hypothetical protein